MHDEQFHSTKQKLMSNKNLIMKKLILLFTIFFSFFALSCEPEEMEYNQNAEIENDVRIYSDTGDQADPTDKKGGDD